MEMLAAQAAHRDGSADEDEDAVATGVAATFSVLYSVSNVILMIGKKRQKEYLDNLEERPKREKRIESFKESFHDLQ